MLETVFRGPWFYAIPNILVRLCDTPKCATFTLKKLKGVKSQQPNWLLAGNTSNQLVDQQQNATWALTLGFSRAKIHDSSGDSDKSSGLPIGIFVVGIDVVEISEFIL